MRDNPGYYPIKWIYFQTPEELHTAYRKDPKSMTMAVVFHGEDPINGPLKYEIRTNPSYAETPSTTELYSSPVACRHHTDSTFSGILPIDSGDSCPVNQYYFSGFVALQALLDYTKIRVSIFKTIKY